ncbi:MAG: hypothetical protein R3B82_02145 [Sandaracinaceae bacterium]
MASLGVLWLLAGACDGSTSRWIRRARRAARLIATEKVYGDR